MTDGILNELRSLGGSLGEAIINKITVERRAPSVTISIVTDKTFSDGDVLRAFKVLRPYVPELFDLRVEFTKLVPDGEMVCRKIREELSASYPAISATLQDGDISAAKTDVGFHFIIKVLPSLKSDEMVAAVCVWLEKNFCGKFSGECVISDREVRVAEEEDESDEIEFEIPAREFVIRNFEPVEGTETRKSAIYLADLNFVGDDVVICGAIEEIRERQYTNKKGVQKSLLNITLNDGTASATITYFIRLRTEEKIRALKVGDSIVCTGKNEDWRGNLRFTADTIDKGCVPEGFVPQKRQSKPVPLHYKKVFPQPFVDLRQGDFFTGTSVPECLKGTSFVVCDLETTGLNSSPVTGNMDKIIEIGAFRVVDGIIKESFSTFVNPRAPLSEEIVNLTGISEEMVAGAPFIEDVIPDFVKFCEGSILVGHNIANFDFKFIEYYSAKSGYILERRLIDTIRLSQQLLFLSNYKLNTVADKFGIEFNHHRAIDDALATAKIFIELIKLKKSLPDLD